VLVVVEILPHAPEALSGGLDSSAGVRERDLPAL
jgi:hypothetical protein